MINIPNIPSDAFGWDLPDGARKQALKLHTETLPRDDVQGLLIDSHREQTHDDAFFVERIGEAYVVYVSVGDVAAFVAPDTPIDIEARRRVQSIYTHQNYPLYPIALTNALSLEPRKKNKTLTIRILLNPDLSIGDVHVYRSELEVRGKYSFRDVEKILDDQTHPEYEAFHEMDELAVRLHDKRSANGHHGSVQWRDQQHCLILEEINILANQAAARYFVQEKLPALFRIRPSHDTFKREQEQTLKEIHANQGPSVIDALRKFYARRINLPLLSADSGIDPGEQYAHVTSPIRKYADSINEAILAASASGEENPLYAFDELSELAAYLNRRLQALERHRNTLQRSRFLPIELMEPLQPKLIEIDDGKRFVCLAEAHLGEEVYRTKPCFAADRDSARDKAAQLILKKIGTRAKPGPKDELFRLSQAFPPSQGPTNCVLTLEFMGRKFCTHIVRGRDRFFSHRNAQRKLIDLLEKFDR